MQCLRSWTIFFRKPRLILLFYGTFCRYARFCCSQSSCFLGTLYYTQNTVSRIKASDLCFGAECFGKKSHCDKRLLKPKKRSTSTPHPRKIFPTIFWYDDFSDTEYGKIDPQCAPRRHNGAILLNPDGMLSIASAGHNTRNDTQKSIATMYGQKKTKQIRRNTSVRWNTRKKTKAPLQCLGK